MVMLATNLSETSAQAAMNAAAVDYTFALGEHLSPEPHDSAGTLAVLQAKSEALAAAARLYAATEPTHV